MTMLADASAADYAAILALNSGAVPHVNVISEDTLRNLHRDACYLRVAKSGAGVDGFLLALPPGVAYDSPNYRWFSRRYRSFVYIDRIVVGTDARRQGVGRLLYADLESLAASRAPILACEVNLRPSNTESMSFHESFGFHEVGQQETESGIKRVRLMIKEVG